MASSTTEFHAARDFLLSVREDYDRAIAEFRWPELTEFNWALDHFDHLPPDDLGLWIVSEDRRLSHLRRPHRRRLQGQ